VVAKERPRLLNVGAILNRHLAPKSTNVDGMSYNAIEHLW